MYASTTELFFTYVAHVPAAGDPHKVAEINARLAEVSSF